MLGSRGNDRIVYTDSGPSAYQALSYVDLDTGIEATVDGGATVAGLSRARLKPTPSWMSPIR